MGMGQNWVPFMFIGWSKNSVSQRCQRQSVIPQVLMLYPCHCLSLYIYIYHPNIPSGKRLHNYGKSPCLMGKSTISMAIFNSYFDITRGYYHYSPCYGIPSCYPPKCIAQGQHHRSRAPRPRAETSGL